MPVHATYGTRPLPALQVVRMEENLAEKISRLNRTTTARDMSVARMPPGSRGMNHAPSTPPLGCAYEVPASSTSTTSERSPSPFPPKPS